MKRIFFIVLMTPLFVFSQQTKEVLFLGNSYTYYNDLPNMIKQIALSFGDTLNYDQNTPGGVTLQNHSSNTQTLSKISQQQWDHVIIQCQSQEPAFSPSQVSNDVFPYAQILIDSIASNYSCTEPIFYMTWGRKNGDQQNCAAYPPVCTYLGMQQRLRESYLEMTSNHNATCAPVGMAWKESINQNPILELYTTDQSHPSLEGSYLAACTFYASLFKKPSIGTTYIPNGIDTATAVFLQHIATNTVLDSMSTWNIFNADFSFQQNNEVINLTNLSSNYESVLWNFGDGSTSNLENPQHIYSSSGTFNIELYVFTNGGCLVDTFSVSINVTSINSVNELDNSKVLQETIDILGKKSKIDSNVILFYLFDDGTVEKRVVIE
ncbi:MAG: PKD domain-containing protein [Bacteroidetes bacterium]|jgi:hypothetical protein|nr:PKD domain-containing protein [Bacteroidota bacterium]